MNKQQLAVKNEVIDLLQQIVNNPDDPEVFDRVAESMIDLVMLGVMPANCESSHGDSNKKARTWEDDFSANKERCIAP